MGSSIGTMTGVDTKIQGTAVLANKQFGWIRRNPFAKLTDDDFSSAPMRLNDENKFEQVRVSGRSNLSKSGFFVFSAVYPDFSDAGRKFRTQLQRVPTFFGSFQFGFVKLRDS